MTRTTWVRRAVAIAAASMLGLSTLGSMASADDIVNDLTGTVKQMALDVGATGTTTLSLTPMNGDGKNGCNLTGNAAYVTFDVESSELEVATVSPGTVTFNTCDDEPVLTVTGVGTGTAHVTLSQTSSSFADRTYDASGAAFTVEVAGPNNTAPQVAITGVEQGATYAVGAVPQAWCEVEDVEDGPSRFPATLSAVVGPDSLDGIGAQTATCSYTDAGGLTSVVAASYTIVDPTPPVIDYTLDPADADGLNGWYTSDVTLSWTVSEPESTHSLVLDGCDDVVVATDQQATDYSCSASSAGGSAGPVTVSIKRDGTAPDEPELVGGPSGDVYFGDPVDTPTCTSDDATSGLMSCAVTGGGSTVGSHSFTGTATDNAGNTSVSVLTYDVLAWEKSGFYKPVTMGDDVWNTVKGGSTVPLKFEMFAGEVERTSVDDIASFTAKAVTCPNGSVTTDDVEFTTTGGTTLRYDAKDGQYVQNWATPKRPGSCYQVTMTAVDGGTISARFMLR